MPFDPTTGKFNHQNSGRIDPTRVYGRHECDGYDNCSRCGGRCCVCCECQDRES